MMVYLKIMCIWITFLGATWLILEYPSDPKYYRWLCRKLKPLLSWYRRTLKQTNWEKWTIFTLSLSLSLVTILTVAARWGVPADPDHEIDFGIYEGIRVAYSVFEGDSSAFRDHLINSPLTAKGPFWFFLLQFLAAVLPVVVPISALTTAITLLWKHLPHHIPIFSQTWFLFSELEPNSVRIARDINQELLKTKESGVFIFLRTQRRDQEIGMLRELQDLNYFLYPHDEIRFLHRRHRRNRVLRFFFLSENTDKNFDQTKAFLVAVRDKELFKPKQIPLPAGQVQHELYLLSETESAPMLIEHLRVLMKDNGVFNNAELRLLDRFRAISYDTLRKKPLHEYIRNGKLNILVLGFGKIGREFFRAACSLGILSGCKTTYTICDQQICSKWNMFLTQCPEIQQSVTIFLRKMNLETEVLEKLVDAGEYHYIVVAMGDDERNIRVASRLKRFYRKRHWEFLANKHTTDIQPQICVNIEDAVKHEYTQGLWDTSLHVFGGLDEVFTQKVLMPRSLWAAAQYIHQELNRKKTQDKNTPKPMLWGEYERRSSITSAVRADYLYHYLRNSNPSAPTWNALYENNLDDLVDVEHHRWMAYVRSEGMRKVTTDKNSNCNLVNIYYEENQRNHVDVLGKLHPCLVDTKAELETLWGYLNSTYPDDYRDKKTFCQRDEFLVQHADQIASILSLSEDI